MKFGRRRGRRARTGRHPAARIAHRHHGQTRLYRAWRAIIEACRRLAETTGLPDRPHHGEFEHVRRRDLLALSGSISNVSFGKVSRAI